MPTYNYKCTKCDFLEKNKKFNSFLSFKEYRCPKCSNLVEQTFDYDTVNFSIKGYSYANEYKGKTIYRDHVKKFEEKLKNE